MWLGGIEEIEMQQLSIRNTYTPTNAPQVRCNCDLPLNGDQSLSVVDLKTVDNNSEVDQSQRKESQNLRVSDIVYVLNMRGKPLMPTRARKALNSFESHGACPVEGHSI